MSRLFFAILIFFIASAANAKNFETQCGGKAFQIEAINKGYPQDNEYRLSIKEAGGAKVLYIANEGGFFHAKCVKAKNGKEYLLFQSYCSGSACVEDRYGIVETGTSRLMLTPGNENVGNSKEATKILGSQAPYLPNEKGTFCCE